MLSTNFWKQKVYWKRLTMFCLVTSSKLSRQWFEFLLKVKVMGSNPGYLLKHFQLYLSLILTCLSYAIFISKLLFSIFLLQNFLGKSIFCPVIEISTGVLILIHCSRSNHRNTIKVNDIYIFCCFFVIALICNVSSQQEICSISQACKEPTPSK